MARTLLEDLVNTVMVEQVEELGCVRNGYRERKLVTKQAMLRLVGAVCIDQNEEWFVATHFMDKRSLLFSLKSVLRESHVHKRPSTISYK